MKTSGLEVESVADRDTYTKWSKSVTEALKSAREAVSRAESETRNQSSNRILPKKEVKR